MERRLVSTDTAGQRGALRGLRRDHGRAPAWLACAIAVAATGCGQPAAAEPRPLEPGPALVAALPPGPFAVAGSAPVRSRGRHPGQAKSAGAAAEPPPPPPDGNAPLPAGVTPVVRITEVMSDPMLVDDVAGEYLELVNASGAAVLLSSLALRMPSGRRIQLQRPAQPWLLPCEVVVIRPLPEPGSIELRGMKLPNRAGEVVLLWGPHPVDVARWTGRWPWPRHRPGAALERRSLDSDGAAAQAWRPASSHLRGVERGSPGTIPWRCSTTRRLPRDP